MSNLTLSIDEDTLKQARLYAIQGDTSVNALVRAYLRSLSNNPVDYKRERRSKAAIDFERLAKEIATKAIIQDEYEFRREDAYENRTASVASRSDL